RRLPPQPGRVRGRPEGLPAGGGAAPQERACALLPGGGAGSHWRHRRGAQGATLGDPREPREPGPGTKRFRLRSPPRRLGLRRARPLTTVVRLAVAFTDGSRHFASRTIVSSNLHATRRQPSRRKGAACYDRDDEASPRSEEEE